VCVRVCVCVRGVRVYCLGFGVQCTSSTCHVSRKSSTEKKRGKKKKLRGKKGKKGTHRVYVSYISSVGHVPPNPEPSLLLN
jgi:hypothetical protein